MPIRRVIVILLAVMTLALPAASAAQSERGSITGVIEDATRAGLPGVIVKVINTATNATIEVVSSSAGVYSATNLPPGTYRIEASLQGFQSAGVDGVRLAAGSTQRINVTLGVGAITETVNVSAVSSMMQSQDAKVTTNVSNELIDQLPLVVGGAMRSVFDLVSTVPEAKGSGTNVVLGGGQGGAFGATLDGISVNTNRNADVVETAFLTPSVEAITEFSVETNGFKPEFGQAGGGAITFASKSGTNQFKGSLYNFLRNDALDEKGFFEATKGTYRQNNFGASLGGPVQIPRLYDGKNRTFFFAVYEGFRNNQAANATTLSVPTPEMYNGDFSNWVDSQGRLIVIYDPATTRPNPNGTGFIRDPFPGNRIPTSRFSAVARQYLALAQAAVVPNRTGLVPGTFGYVSNNFLSPGGTTRETTHKLSVKVDHALSGAHRLSYLFNRAANETLPGENGAVGLPAPFNGFQTTTNDADLHRGSWDWIAGPRTVNHLSVGVNTFNKNAYSPNVDQGWSGKVCIPNAVDCNQNFGIISFSEFSTWGGSSYNGTEQPRFSIKDDLTIIKGSHTIKSGFTFDRQQANGFGQQDLGGRAGFSFLETAVPGTTTSASGGGSSFASFLLGVANTGRTETIRYLQQIYPYYGFYLQDDWRINDKLVLNYGVRYEFTNPPRAGGDQYSDFSPTKPNPAVNNHPGALVFAGDGPGREGKSSLFPGFYGAVAPRASFAYSLNDKTIVRGGVGRSFGRVTVVQGSSHFAGFIGQYVFSSADAGVTPAFNLDQGLPSYPLPPLIDPAFSNNNDVDWFNGQAASRPAQYDNWTVSVQREVWTGMTVELDYNGVYGSHLQAGLLNPNQVPMSVVNDLIARLGPIGARDLLNSQITSPAAVAAGIPIPYANFTNPNVQRSRTVAQALRPYPQYLAVNVQSGGGDKTGRSHYHAGVLKVNQRLRGGVSLQSSYTYSKLMSDADSFSGSGRAMDAARPELEWSVGRFDQTHNIKINSVIELPFGAGRRWLQSGIANQIVGGWRLSIIQAYSSGLPIGVTTNAPLNIFNGTNRPNVVAGVAWRAPMAGDEFNPRVDRFLNRAAFVQPVGALGNAPRINGDVRRFWNLNENMSLAKSIKAGGKLDVDVRVEAFNVFNRVIWGAPNIDFSSNNFGLITALANTPRQMQLGLKLVLVRTTMRKGNGARDVSRRHFLEGLGVAPFAPAFSTAFHQRAAAERKRVKIRDVQVMLMQGPGRHYTLVKITADDGRYGMAEAYGSPGVGVKEQILSLKPWLVGKDPLQIDTLYTQLGEGSTSLSGTRTDGSAHNLIRAASGIEMALWDLAGKVLEVPTSTLLGGRFRDRVRVYDHATPRPMLDKKAVGDWAAKVKSHPSGFTCHKMDLQHTDPATDLARDPSNRMLTTKELIGIRQGYENCRDAIGWDHDLMAHCHWEYDLRTSIQIAEAVESSKPVWLEDPLPVDYSDSWKRLCASSKVPICMGENLARREGFKDFILNQGCDILHPDLRNAGGFLETKRIADLAHIFGLPMANHNTGSQVCTYASAQWAASIRDYMSLETITGEGGWMDQVLLLDGPYIKDGFIQVTDKPGLGIELNPDVVRAHLAPGELWWG